MKKKIAILMILSLAFVSIATGCGGGGNEDTEQTYTLTYNSIQGTESEFFKQVEEPFCKALEELSDGRIQVEIYNSGSMAAQGEVYDAVIAGTVDMGWDNPGTYSGRFPMAAMIDQSGLGFESSRMAGEIYKEYFDTYCQDEFSEVKMLVPYCIGPMAIATTKKVDSLDAAKGLQIRSGGSTVDALSTLGFVPNSMAITEVYESIRLNMISGVLCAVEAIDGFNLDEVTNYAVLPTCFNGSQMIFMNKDVYASLPEDLQAVVDQAAEETYQVAIDFHDKRNAELFESLDFEVVKLSDEENAKWNDLTIKITEEYAKSLDEKDLPGTEALNFIKDKVKAYNK